MNVHALVIGNNQYGQAPVLTNAINDAVAVADKFKQLGYKVEPVKDFVSADMPNILDKFATDLSADIEVGIFYFAGHAFEVENKNYIAPIDCPLNSRELSNCRYFSLELDRIIKILDDSNCSIKIIILDACRNNPFDKAVRGFENIGLAPINVTKGYIIAFSTSPGKTANDSPNQNNSIYTQSLLSHIDEKHLPIESFFKKVRETVYALSEGSQVTWEHTSLIGNFCFNQGQIGFGSLPYDEEAIKDYKYVGKGTEVDKIISQLKSCNYYIQNPTINAFKNIDPRLVDKNQQFVMGRNILQASENAWDVTSYVNNLEDNIMKYQTVDGENHILNGILFEIYFDSHGSLRTTGFKNKCINKIFSLQYSPAFSKSFQFINDLLSPYQDFIYYMPNGSEDKLSVTVNYETQIANDFFGNPQTYNVIKKISIGTRDITNVIKYRFYVQNATKDAFANAIATQITALPSDIKFNPDIPDDNLYLNK